MAITNSSCDFAVLKNVSHQINKTQKEMYDIQQVLSSDVKAQHYYDMDAPMANQSIEVEYLIRQNETKLRNYEWSQNLLFVQEGALRNLQNITTDAKKLGVRAMDQLGTNATVMMPVESKNLLSRIEDTFSLSFSGMNIWNGSRTNEKPFTDLVNGVPGDNYYLGDDFDLQFYVNNHSVEFGDRANYDCFKKLVQGIQMMRDAQDPQTLLIDKDKIQQASILIDEAQDGLSALIQKAGNAQQDIVSAKALAEDSLANLSEMYGSTLNGMTEMDRAITAIDAAAVQRKLSYLLPITMKYINDMTVIKYL